MAVFDPAVHLAYEAPKHHLSMADIGLGHLKTLSSVACTDPFPLMSLEGVKALREEIFAKPIVENFHMKHALAKCQLRGYAPDFAPFTAALWTHPDTIKACSEAAGMDLVPIMPYELGHINVQAKEGLESLGRDPLPPLPALVRSESDDSSDDDTPEAEEVVHWHIDSYPWVCVVMLSDASTMMGGDTALEGGDGKIYRVRGPQIGWAVMMQGKYINHMACGAWNARERVTMVTSFRAKDSSLLDDSTLRTIRICSDVNDIYYQWASYRLKLLSERFQGKYDQIQDKKHAAGLQAAGKFTDIIGKDDFKEWVSEQIKYLQMTMDEIV
ncbi:hypothetical protein DACRYDRAFT_25344 [Dacryopinax primogenitus]|uniref:Fe2OG dioxygenase domain-containing protein n=1 Tax=Dacryopinax primogenitus (strain DJM 731) TaxID=1858805 RepID=M5FQC0_DACPD|nr:uncharacterized protein DACRYDRAFT_25344 [Dacryopinax primogenitus]EJT96879.1 hypothetical protein DACRYDRAFT_25344 [Dacryopinax primogenitus]